MKVIYVAQYVNINEHSNKYWFSPAGIAKMDYFLYCLNQIGVPVNVYSFCLSKDGLISLPHTSRTKYNQPIHFALTFKKRYRWLTKVGICLLQIQLFLKLWLSSRGDIIYIYHERFYSPVIKLVSKLRKLKIILDVEEIYTLVAKLDEKSINNEIRGIEGYDKYTLANIHLAQELNLNENQYVVCNGVYSPIISRETIINDNETKVLYSGTFKHTKGAFSAVEAFRFLNRSFKLYVCGFGNEIETNNLKSAINIINREKGYEAIKFLGFVESCSKEYQEILTSCDIGLATQNNLEKYNTTSFPSKIFEYIRHGIKVVATKVPGVEDLPVSKYLTLIESNSPEQIARGIETARHSQNAGQLSALKEMHDDFLNKFRILLNR